MSDARSLVRGESEPRALALTALAVEELSKVSELHDTFIHAALGDDRWSTFWKEFYRHGPKQDAADRYGRRARKRAEEAGLGYSLYVLHDEGDLADLDAVKQACFYVDFDGRAFVRPGERSAPVREALDEVLAFAEERVDAFAAQHCTPRRSRQALEARMAVIRAALSTGKVQVPSNIPGSGGKAVDPVEAFGDLMTAIQVCNEPLVPNYMHLSAWFAEYPYDRETLIGGLGAVRDVLLMRMRDGEALSRSWARNYGAYKLWVFLNREAGEPVAIVPPAAGAPG